MSSSGSTTYSHFSSNGTTAWSTYDPLPDGTASNLYNERDPNPKKVWASIKDFFGSLFGSKEKRTETVNSTLSFAISTPIIVGQVSPVGRAFTLPEFMASLEGLGTGVLSTACLTAGALLYPAMIKEPEYNWTRDLPIAVPVTTTDDVPEKTMTLFRGVHGQHPDLENAIPWGGSATAYQHNMGNNNSMYTSWTKNIDVANYSASRRGPGGVILKETFPISRLFFYDRHNEGEVQVFGPVHGAQVIKPWNGGNWTPYIK